MMPMLDRRADAFAVLLAAAAMAGCAHRAPEMAAPPARLAPADRASEIDAIIALLDRGDGIGASPRIDALLRGDPADPQARVLRDSLDREPVDLLGANSFAYTVRPGETMLALSERFLGNRLKSYQLARYNHVAVPAALAAGTVLRIPGEPPHDDPASRPAPRPRSTPRARIQPSGAPSAPSAPRTDPAAARQARAAGLAALGRGRIVDAVAALRRAAALDPGDPLIARDLARAERVAATVPARR